MILLFGLAKKLWVIKALLKCSIDSQRNQIFWDNGVGWGEHNTIVDYFKIKSGSPSTVSLRKKNIMY